MKCRNCGAELNNSRCEYCGSRFDNNVRRYERASSAKDDDSVMHKVQIKDVLEITCIGDEKPVYIEV